MPTTKVERTRRFRRDGTLQRPHCVAGLRGLELANVILKKPLKCWGNSSLDLRNILGPETFRVRAARRLTCSFGRTGLCPIRCSDQKKESRAGWLLWNYRSHRHHLAPFGVRTASNLNSLRARRLASSAVLRRRQSGRAAYCSGEPGALPRIRLPRFAPLSRRV
jgi:hypothetical protein